MNMWIKNVSFYDFNNLHAAKYMSCFLLFAYYFQNQLLKKNLSSIPIMSNILEPDQGQHFVGPDLGPKCNINEGVDRGGGGTGIEGAESGVEGAESGVEGAGSGSRGGEKRGNCGRGSWKIGGRNCFFY